MYWLCYHRAGRLQCVVIVEADGLMMARLRASIAGLGAGGVFVEGHVLDARCRAALAPEDIGRMLSPQEAAAIIERFEAAKVPVKRDRKRAAR